MSGRSIGHTTISFTVSLANCSPAMSSQAMGSPCGGRYQGVGGSYQGVGGSYQGAGTWSMISFLISSTIFRSMFL